MSEVAEKSDSIYVFHNHIVKNLNDGDLNSFLASKRLLSNYKKSRQSIEEYITNLITNGEVTIEELNIFLAESLVFGKHKDVYIYNLQNEKFYSESEIEDILNLEFEIDTIYYNELARAYDLKSDKFEALAYINPTEVDKASGVVKKLQLIFVKKVKYLVGLKTFYENSYFPIDIDFTRRQMIVKSYPKDYIHGDERGVVLAPYFAKKVKSAFDLEDSISLQSKYQRALYKMCYKLLDSVIQEKSRMQIENLDEIVKVASNLLLNELSENLDIIELHKKYKKNIFNMEEQIMNIIENVTITKILLEAEGKTNNSIEGLISSIKFKEKSAVNAVLKNSKRSENLLDSHSYLNLRNTLKETMYAEEIKLIWFNGKKEVSLKYDASNMNYLIIHFYRKFLAEDLEYAIEKLYEFCTEE